MNRRASFTAAAAIFVGIAVSLLAPSLSAVGQTSPPQLALQIGSRATLVAQGAAVEVPVRVTVNCAPTTPAFLQVQVAQVVGNRVGHAFGSTTDIVCDGAPHTVAVFAVSNDLRFHTGPAFASATLNACGFFPGPFGGCGASAARTIRVVKG